MSFDYTYFGWLGYVVHSAHHSEHYISRYKYTGNNGHRGRKKRKLEEGRLCTGVSDNRVYSYVNDPASG